MQDNNFNTQWGNSPFNVDGGTPAQGNTQSDGFSHPDANGNAEQNRYGGQNPQQNNYQQSSNPFYFGQEQTSPWNGGQQTPPTPAWVQNPGSNSYGFEPMRTAKKKKSKLPLIIAIAASVLVVTVIAVVLFLTLGGGDDSEATTASVTNAVTTDTAAVTASTVGGNTPAVTTAATSSNIQTVTNPDGTKEVTYYALNGEILSKDFYDAFGNRVKEQTFLNGAMTGERRFENGKTVYLLQDDGNTKTITKYNRDANGKTVDGSITVYNNNNTILEEQILNPYENPVIIKYYDNGKLERTRTYIISAAGTRDGYVDEYVDGRRFKFDMQGNPISEVATTAATTAKTTAATTAKTTAATTAQTGSDTSGEHTESTGWVNGRKVDTTYSASGAKIREVTYKMIGNREVEILRLEYGRNPKTKTEYNRHPSTGDVTRTIYWEFKQNPNNYTLYMIKDEAGNITKYETYERDDNGKILKTFIHDTASGEILYYIKHEAHGNYKYSPDGKYLGNA